MTPADIIILIVVVLLLGLIIYFSIIRPRIKHQSGCSKCPYSKDCGKAKESAYNCTKNTEQVSPVKEEVTKEDKPTNKATKK